MSGFWESLQRTLIRTFYVRWLGLRGRAMSFEDPRGPIQGASWATFFIDGHEHSDGEKRVGAGSDLRIIGSEVTPWSERRGHRLAPAMITGVFDRGLETLILGLGYDQRLDCPPEVVDEIRRRGIPEVILTVTPEACRLFNEAFRAGRRVGLLIHGTC